MLNVCEKTAVFSFQSVDDGALYMFCFRDFFKAKSFINNDKSMFRRSSFSTLSKVRLFSRFCAMDDLSWLLISFNFENDLSPEQFEIMRLRYMRYTVKVFGNTASRLFSTRNLCVCTSNDSWLYLISTSSGRARVGEGEVAVGSGASNDFLANSVFKRLLN